MHFDIAIIGGGFSGTAVAYHIMQNALVHQKKLSCILFEPLRVAAGIAYGTQSAVHLLNVPASKMSICDEAPLSFAAWLQNEHPSYSPHSFVPRRYYHSYLLHSLASKKTLSREFVDMQFRKTKITSLSKEGDGTYKITTEDGQNFSVKKVVLAMGNSPGAGVPTDAKSVFLDPSDEPALCAAAKTKEIAIIGTGLTAVDTVLSLEANSFTGNYTLISRHGKFPQPHAAVSGTPNAQAKVVAQKITELKNLRGALRNFRESLDSGIEWRDLIDALRPQSQVLWQSFSSGEKLAFINHLRSRWDIHRHRVPAESLQQIERLKSQGRLRTLNGAVQEGVRQNGKILIQLKKTLQENRLYDAVVDCRGLWSRLDRCQSALLHKMISDGLASYDEFFLGLKTDSRGALISKNGTTEPTLFTLGSLRRGQLWETSAVREIRAQAKEIADTLVTEL